MAVASFLALSVVVLLVGPPCYVLYYFAVLVAAAAVLAQLLQLVAGREVRWALPSSLSATSPHLALPHLRRAFCCTRCYYIHSHPS